MALNDTNFWINSGCETEKNIVVSKLIDPPQWQ